MQMIYSMQQSDSTDKNKATEKWLYFLGDTNSQ